MKIIKSRLVYWFRDENNQIEIDFLIAKLKIKHRFDNFIFETQIQARNSQNFDKKTEKGKNGKKMSQFIGFWE